MIRTSVRARPSLSSRFDAFVLERFPFARKTALEALNAIGAEELSKPDAIDRARSLLPAELRPRFAASPESSCEPTPGVPVQPLVGRRGRAGRRLRRVPPSRAIEASLTADERREILRGMVLTRATDNRLKTFFTSGEVRYEDAPFQGKGFRSLGQEAIYAAAIRFRRGAEHQHDEGWNGDVIAPLIRDLGAILAMSPHAARWSATSCPRRWARPARR